MAPSRAAFSRPLARCQNQLSRSRVPVRHWQSFHCIAVTPIRQQSLRLFNSYSGNTPVILRARPYSSEATSSAQRVEPPDFLDEKEKSIFLQLREELQPTALEVQDVSGGCGSMYAVAVTSERFKGLSVIKQHRLVNDILKKKIKDWHGLQLRTMVP